MLLALLAGSLSPHPIPPLELFSQVHVLAGVSQIYLEAIPAWFWFLRALKADFAHVLLFRDEHPSSPQHTTTTNFHD